MATLKELRDEARSLARDTALVDTDRLWPDADMNNYINRIERYIARESRCIMDSTTPAICILAMTPVDYTTYTPGTLDFIWANDPGSALFQLDVAPYLYDLDPRIIDVDEIKLMTAQWELIKVSARKWQDNTYWEQVVSIPTEFATDLQNRKIAVNYRLETADTMQMVVTRLPLADLVNDGDVPEIRIDYHDLMLNGILWRMYLKRDADTFDKVKAREMYEDFLEDLDIIKQQETLLDTRLRPNNSMTAFR